jgi:hypothetical protein
VIDRHLKPSMTDFIASLAEGIHSVDLVVDEEAVQEAEVEETTCTRGKDSAS